jgi:hypothetical protein
MKKFSVSLMSSAFLVASCGLGLAADVANTTEQGATGSFAMFGQGVIPSGYEVNETEGARDCNDEDVENFCDTAFGFGGDVRVHLPLQGQGLSIQLEGLGDWHRAFDKNDADEDQNSLYHVGGAHIISRSGNLAFGAFGGVSFSDHISEGEASTSNHWIGGVELAAFLNSSTTIFAQVGYSGAYGGQDYVDDLVFGRVGARYFMSDNDRLEGWVGYGQTDTAEAGEDDRGRSDSESSGLNWLQLAANYERQLTASPVSVFVGYQGDYVDNVHHDDSGSYERTWAHAVKVGVRFNFGESLISEDRNGSRTFDLMNLRAPLNYADDLEPFFEIPPP